MSTGLSYLIEELPYGFCPGCSHGMVTDALGAALAQLSPAVHNVALVSDIGCVGLIDKHFAVNTFHGLHGRSITYGIGLKLARPDLHVFVVIGDGGCGIGGHHLIQAARRNVDMTVVVFNNFNYGMTGGEHSATSPLGSITSSTPGGNEEVPLDLCALATAAGAPFVARAAAFDKDLPTVVARGAQHPGFALIDVWELCTAYFMPSNDFRKSELMALSEQTGMPFGVLRDEPRPRVKQTPRPAPTPLYLEPELSSPLSRPVGLVVAGSAGQKVKSAATQLGRAAIRSGLFATQKDDYPITVKTGHSVSELIISPRVINYTGIEAPDVMAVLTEDGLERVHEQITRLPSEARVYASSDLELPSTCASVIALDLGAVAHRVGRENLALWTLAFVGIRENIVTADALRSTVTAFTPAKYRVMAMRAIEEGALMANADVSRSAELAAPGRASSDGGFTPAS